MNLLYSNNIVVLKVKTPTGLWFSNRWKMESKI